MSELPYQNLTPDLILDAVESCGHRCDGRQYALNSFENRVYQVWLRRRHGAGREILPPATLERRRDTRRARFARELAQREIPVVAPLADAQGVTLHEHGGYRFALFPKQAGRAPELDSPDTLRWLGRFLGRIHAVGALKPFKHRPRIDIASFGDAPARFVVENDFVPDDLKASYQAIVRDALERVALCYERAGAVRNIRLHGDCHAGNILWTRRKERAAFRRSRRLPQRAGGAGFVDAVVGGCGSDGRAARARASAAIASSAISIRRKLTLIEALRTLRMIHYAGWLASRWARPGVSGEFSVVQHAALLAGPDTGAARAMRRDGRAAA